MSEVLTPTMINEKTQIHKVVSLLKGLERNFYAEDENRFFTSKNSKPLAFTRKNDEVQLWGAKIGFSSSA